MVTNDVETIGAFSRRLTLENTMRSALPFTFTTRHLLLLATLTVFANISTVQAQTPASPANKAAAPAPMTNQPMPMEKKDPSMSAPQGMAQGGGDMRSSMSGMMKNMESMKLTGDSDRDFAAMMKMHHQGAIDMAQQELKSGKDSKMRAMAQRIIDAQKKEIKEFDQWLEKHK